MFYHVGPELYISKASGLGPIGSRQGAREGDGFTDPENDGKSWGREVPIARLWNLYQNLHRDVEFVW